MATYNRKEINTDVLTLVNRANEINNRNEKARAYSRAVAKRRKTNERKENMAMILTVVIVLAIILFGREPMAELIVWLGGMM